MEIQKEQHALALLISVPEGYASVEHQLLVLQSMSIPVVPLPHPVEPVHAEEKQPVLANLIRAVQVSG